MDDLTRPDPTTGGPIELIIESHAKDLGEFEVRRTLPSKQRQRVGPFIFFDHMGPAEFPPSSGVADAGGTPYAGGPLEWSFTTSTAAAPGGQVHPERFHIRLPD